MKLLFVGPYPPPYGGIASHLYELLPQLAKKGYEAVSLTSSSIDKINKSPNMKNIFINMKKFLFKNLLSVLSTFVNNIHYMKDMKLIEFLRVINLSRAVINIVIEEKPEVVLIYDTNNSLIIPILRTYLGKSIYICFLIYNFYKDSQKYINITNYLKITFDKTDAIIASSQYCADSISNVLGYEFPVRVIYVGIDHHVYTIEKTSDKIRNELGIPSSAIVFLFLGRMGEDMGLDFLLEIAPRLLTLYPDIYLILAGAIGDLSEMAKKLSQREPRVKYCPSIPFENKSHYYAACNVFLAPTKEKHACMGVSIKEAMACGKPIIASVSGGIPELLENGVNGYLVPFSDGRLNENIFINYAKILANDKSLRDEMGKKGRDKVMAMCSNDITTQKYIDLLDEIIIKE